MEKDEVITLKDRGFIQVKGSEAKDFLQNIVTNDIEKVTSSSTVFSSILTPQGKYLFEFCYRTFLHLCSNSEFLAPLCVSRA